MRPVITPNGTIDRRTYPTGASDLSIRSNEDASTSLVGYAVNYNKRSELLYGMFHEEIAPGAFDESCRNEDIRAFWSHDSSLVLGRTKSGTLQCVSDEIGVRFTCTPPKTTFMEHCIESMRRGDVDQMSFGFYVPDEEDEEWSSLPDGTYLRRVLRGKLVEISPVAIPAYSQSTVMVSDRSLGGLDAFKKRTNGQVRLADWDLRIRMASAKHLHGRK